MSDLASGQSVKHDVQNEVLHVVTDNYVRIDLGQQTILRWRQNA